MNNVHLSLACLAITTLGQPSQSLGHGTPIPVGQIGGKLVVSGGFADDRGYASWVFADPDGEAVFIPVGGNRLFTDLPGFEIAEAAIGQRISLQVTSRPDFTKAATPARWLWYSDDVTGAVVDVPLNPLLDLSSAVGFTPGVAFFQSVAPVNSTITLMEQQSPDLGEHDLLNYFLNNASAALGTYGFFARLTSLDYLPSDPFLVALNHGLDAETFEQGAKRINAAARLPGDSDGDEDVDGADLLVWQRTLGSMTLVAADQSFNGVVDAADLSIWRDNFGRVSPTITATVAAIPEPTATALAVIGSALLAAAYRGKLKTP